MEKEGKKRVKENEGERETYNKKKKERNKK